MNISDLIAQLERVREQHGNLRCVTPGFDESGYDDIDDLTIQQIELDVHPAGVHAGAHEAAHIGPGTGRVEDCVVVNF